MSILNFYSIKEAAELLHISERTLERWMRKADIYPESSVADSRLKFLRFTQIIELANAHRLIVSPSVQNAVILKLQEQMKALEAKVNGSKDTSKTKH